MDINKNSEETFFDPNDKKRIERPKMASPELLKELVTLSRQLSKKNISETVSSQLKKEKGEAETAMKPKEIEKETEKKETDTKTEEKNHLKTYQEAFDFIRNASEKLAHHEKLELGKEEAIVTDIIKKLDRGSQLSSFAINNKYMEENLTYHSVNVTVLALNVGMLLTDSEKKLIDLGKAALLHDLGLYSVSNDIIYKRSRLTHNEFEIIKMHTLQGYDILSPFGKDYAQIGEVILQTHERNNGQGYPNGLKDNEIIENAKIIGIADVYESLTHERPYRKALPPNIALQQIIKDKEFSKDILKAFIQKISIFPEGSFVKLNNGSIVKVVKSNINHPFKPVVEIVSTPRGTEHKTGKILDMTEVPFLYIVQLVTENESISAS